MTGPRDPISMSRQDYQYFMKELARARGKAAGLGQRIAKLEDENAKLEKGLHNREDKWDDLRDLLFRLNELLDYPLPQTSGYPEE